MIAKTFSWLERGVDVGIFLVDDVGCREDGVHAVLSGDRRGAGQREESADFDLFGGKGRRRGEEGGAKNQHNDNRGALT